MNQKNFMVDAYLKENDIILAEIQVGQEVWVNQRYITVFGVESTTRNGSLSFGRRTMDKDITDEVSFDLNDEECLPVNQCACGQKYPPWDFTLSVYKDEPKCCPTCGRWMYFTVSIRVFEREKP